MLYECLLAMPGPLICIVISRKETKEREKKSKKRQSYADRIICYGICINRVSLDIYSSGRERCYYVASFRGG
jgi:hypothetical protein